MRGLLWKFYERFVDITPTPTFGRVIPFDDGMTRRAKMCSGVTVGRLITAADVPAKSAYAQMEPHRADLKALLTPKCTGFDSFEGANMGARVRHSPVPLELFTRSEADAPVVAPAALMSRPCFHQHSKSFARERPLD